MKKLNAIDKYIMEHSAEKQIRLKQLRAAINKAAPGAEEVLNYGIPTLKLEGNLVHYGAYKNHIGFYPAPSGIKAFKDALSVYKGAKGSIQFPLDTPLPIQLIEKIVKFRVQENLEIAAGKKKR